MWQDILTTRPADAQTVWVRRLYYDTPILATYRASLLDFAILPATLTLAGFDDAAYNGPSLLQPSFNQGSAYWQNATPRYIAYDAADHVYVLADNPNKLIGVSDWYSPGTLPSTVLVNVNGTGAAGTITPLPFALPAFMVARWRPQ